MALLLIVVMTFVTVAGCIDPYPSGSDSMPPPFRVTAHVEDSYMVDVGRYNAQIWLMVRGQDQFLAIEDLTLDRNLSKGDGSDGPAYMYNDTNGDRIVSRHDGLDFFNLTEDHLTTYQLFWRTEFLVEFSVEWDDGNMLSYLISLTPYPTKLAEGDLYNKILVIYHARVAGGLTYGDIDMTYVSSEGLLPDEITVRYTDTDGNGILSKDDTFELSNITKSHEHGEIHFTVSGQIVGRTFMGRFSDG